MKLTEIIKLIPGYDPYRDAGDCVFDEKLAQRAIEFFRECLCFTKGEKAGRPFVLEPWQKAIAANIFGWVRREGTRRYRDILIFVGRKNGKTELAAGIALYVLFCDNEPGAEIYSAAAEREQAALCFNAAKSMVVRDASLSVRAKIYQKAIVYEEQGSTYKAISADAHTKHGYNSHLALIDELHAQPNRDLVDVLKTSTVSRRQPLTIYMTTSDYERESICNETHDYASKVRDGIIKDDTFLPVIYEATLADDWTSPETWRKANPNLGVSVKEEHIKEACLRAQASPAFENTFKRLHLNIRTEQATRWISMDKWDACGSDRDEASLEGMLCYGGLDMASSIDIAAFVLVFPQEDGGFVLLPRFWVPRENLQERDKQGAPYTAWVRDGYLIATEGNVIDQDFIEREIVALGERFDIKEIPADRWNTAQLVTHLAGAGFEVIGFGQGYASMSAPSKAFEAAVIGGKLDHRNNPVLRWMASNVMAETDAADNIKPTKKKSTGKIDGITATIMGIGRAISQDADPGSVYTGERGLLTL